MSDSVVLDAGALIAIERRAPEIQALVATALRVGALLGGSGATDVVDAAVVVRARDRGMAPVITSTPTDLRRLDASLPLITV